MNSKKNILKNLKNTYCRLKPSKISGVGVFAVRDIPENIDPFASTINQKWSKFKMAELKNLDREILKMIDDFFVIEKDKTVYIPELGLNGMDVSFFPNHSANPNLKAIYDKNEITVFITKRKIKKGEELTADYAVYDDKYKTRNTKIVR